MFKSRPTFSTLAVIAVATSTLALSACGGSADPAPVATVVVTAEPSDGPSPIASAVAEATADAKEAIAEATADAKEAITEATSEAKAEPFTMPNVVGMNLQDAQDLLQTFDSYLMDQEDASGLERFQLNDSNWQVCTQEPAAGATTETTDIVTLGAVKLDESC